MTDPKRPDEPATPADAMRTPAADDVPSQLDAKETPEGSDQPLEPGKGLERAADEGIAEPLTEEEATRAALEGAAATTSTTPRGSRTRGAEGTAGPATRAGGTDELPYIDDAVSKLFVGAIVLVFAGILLYALLLGKGGALSPPPTDRPTREPTPVVSISPSPVGSVRPSGSAGASGSPSASPSGPARASASPSEAASGSIAPSGSAASSGSPDPSGSAAPSASAAAPSSSP